MKRLFEFQAREIFKRFGIPITNTQCLIKDLNAVSEVLDNLKFPCVLKAQVLSGGRGKAGGIRIARTKEEIPSLVKQIFDLRIGGERTYAILITDYVEIERELYTSIVIDTVANNITALASPLGGIDIEEIARRHPAMIYKLEIDPFIGLKTYQARSLAKWLGLTGKPANDYVNILTSLYKILTEYDAELVEINPLALTKSGELVAIDAKIVLNDQAYYRHKEVFDEIQRSNDELNVPKDPVEEKIKALGATAYIDFEKEGIAIVSDGAGIGMYAYDLINELGGAVAIYCELGLANTADRVYQALKILSSNPRIKLFLVNWFGGSNVMDEMCKGLVQFLKDNKNIPIVARIAGTHSHIAHEMLKNTLVFVTEDIDEAVKAALDMVR